MTTIKQITADDKQRWNAFVGHQSNALLAHQFAWRNFIAETFKLIPQYWVAEDDGEIVGIAPFFVRNHLGLGKRLTSMPYLNTGGILATSPTVYDELWKAISRWATENGIGTIELRNRYQVLPGYEARQGRSVSIIPLPDSEQTAWDNLRSVARNRIRKAEKAGLEIRIGVEHFGGFWTAYAENMHLLGAPVLPQKWFKQLFETSALNAHLLTVFQANKPLGGMVLLGFKDGVENTWTGSTVAARRLYVNDFLYWHATKWAVDRGLKRLDLGRSEAGGGHEKFKEKFNAQTTPLPYQELRRTAIGWEAATEEPTTLYNTFSAVWGRLPMSVATRIGGYFSRQVY